MRALSPLLFAILLWPALPAHAAPPGPANAQVIVPDLPPVRQALSKAEQARAQAAYNKAQEFVAKGELDGALYAANTAHQLVGNASTAMVKAYILELLKRPEAAFASYLAVLDLQPTKAEANRATDRLKALGLALSPPRGWVVLVVSPKDAQVKLGGEEFKGSRSLGITDGRHALSITAPGHVSFRGAIEVSRGAGQRLLYELSEKAPVAAASGGNQTFTPGLATLISGLVLAGGGVGAHVWAMDRGSESVRLAEPGTDGMAQEARRSAHQSATDDAELGRILTAALYGIGGVLVVTGAVLMAIDDSDATSGEGSVNVSVRGGIGPTSWIGLGGAF